MFTRRNKITVTLLITLLITMSAFTYAQAEKKYETVVLRGSLAPLDWSSNNNPLTYNQSTGTWQSQPISLKGGETLQFKYVYNGNWMPGNNLKFTPARDGKYVFTFYPKQERKVDVQLVSNYQGKAILEVTVPDETPDWATLTLGTNLNDFNYKLTKLKQKDKQVWTIELTGKPGKKITYRYALGDKRYTERKADPRQAAFTKEDKVYQDQITAWESIPVAKNVSHSFNHQPSIPDNKDQVKIKATVKHYGNVDTGAIYYTTDGSAPAGKRGKIQNGQVISLEVKSSTTNKKGVTTSVLTGKIPAQKNQTPVKYKIDVWDKEGQGSQFADTNSRTAAKATEFAYYVDDYQTPQWAKDAIIYQVFVDRFRDGNKDNNEPGVAKLPHDQQLKKWMGGDLAGLKEKLDYIADLGVNAIWISPVYKGPYSHGYHPADFKQIDPHFGNAKLMKEIVKKAHEKDIKVIYDFVANHSSNRHPFFQDALEKGKQSKYYDWYSFTDWPNKYETFYDIKELPEFNNDNYQARNYMLNEVVPYWLNELGVDGFRLDYAKGPSYSFWVDFRNKVKQLDSEAYIFGEIWDNRQKIDSYEGELDGAIGFGMHGAFNKTFAQDKSMRELTATVEKNLAAFDDQYIINSFLDSHDMPRFLFEAGGDVKKLKLAAAAQFTLPGTPIIYYGDEVGLSQSGDHNAVSEWKDRYYREPMPWNKADQNLDVKDHYKELIKLRKQEVALRRGSYKTLYTSQDILLFKRSYEDQEIVVAINKGSNSEAFSLHQLLGEVADLDDSAVELLTDKELQNDKEGELILPVAPESVGVYKVSID
ncbi:hypothetical protein JCM16358_20200 [Halanaerocella petrolearia]